MCMAQAHRARGCRPRVPTRQQPQAGTAARMPLQRPLEAVPDIIAARRRRQAGCLPQQQRSARKHTPVTRPRGPPRHRRTTCCWRPMRATALRTPSPAVAVPLRGSGTGRSCRLPTTCAARAAARGASCPLCTASRPPSCWRACSRAGGRCRPVPCALRAGRKDARTATCPVGLPAALACRCRAVRPICKNTYVPYAYSVCGCLQRQVCCQRCAGRGHVFGVAVHGPCGTGR